jgi:chromosome segregation ATPase
MRQASASVPSWRELAQAHEDARQKAAALFREPGVFDTAGKETFVEALNQELAAALLQSCWPAVENTSRSTASSLIEKLLPSLDQGHLDLNKLLAELSSHTDIGPARHEVFHQALSRDIILARLAPQLEKQKQEGRFLQHQLDETGSALVETRGKLANTCSQLQEQKDEVLGLKQQLAAASATLESERLEHNETRKRLETALVDLQQSTLHSGQLEQEAHAHRQALASKDEDLKALGQELDEIIAAAAEQQAAFDETVSQLQDQAIADQVARMLLQVCQQVETDALLLQKKRLEEERAVIHEQLQRFYQTVSTLPEWLQEYF